jgi:hypothetical protein
MSMIARPPSLRTLGVALAVLLLLVVATAVAAAPGAPVVTERAEVSYRNPASFTEMDRSPNESREWLDVLSRYIAKRASRTLPDGERLLVTITDVQRAGQLEPWRSSRWSDTRFVRDTTPPRIDLTFQLVSAQGAVLKEDTRQLRDANFLTRGIFHRGEALGYEKNLIDAWLRADFGPPRR